MKLFTIVRIFLALALATPIKGYLGCDSPTTVTQLDFFNASLTVNTLHLPDGELRYTGIGVYMNESIDLRVRVNEGGLGDYTNIVNGWASKNPPKTAEDVNGYSENGGKFGNINLQTKKGVPFSGQGDFEFCIVSTVDDSLVTLSNFSFTVWDLDWRLKEKNLPPDQISVKEKLIIDTSQALNYSVFPDFETSQVRTICEDGSNVTCTDPDCSGVHPGHASCPGRTVFLASKKGVLSDNPSDPEDLTPKQKKRAVYFYFENTSCFNITYSHYCPVDDPVNFYDVNLTESPYVEQGYTQCKMSNQYSGGNFLFAGDSEDLFHDPGCPGSETTLWPSHSPSESFSPSESNQPSSSPSVSHLPSYSKFPSVYPSVSSAPSSSPSDGPSASPSGSPSGTPTVSAAPSTTPSGSPSVSLQPTEDVCYADALANSGPKRIGQMDFCVRTGLGYTNAATSEFKEVNFIETLVTIKYDLTSGFCVVAFNVEPKIREGITVQEDAFGLEAYLCDPEDTETLSNPTRSRPKRVTDYDYNTTNPFSEDDAAQYFNQGALITVCVAPDAPSYAEGVRMDGLTNFEWYREANITNGAGSTNDNPEVPGWNEVSQTAITNDNPANNMLTSYIKTQCEGGYEYCHFSSILFADFYAIRGFVSGTGSGNLRFVAPDAAPLFPSGIARRLSTETDEEKALRRLQDGAGESAFDLLVGTDVTDDGVGDIRTAGGNTSGLSILSCVVALISGALLA